MNDQYLWDLTGKIDPDIQRLEKTLSSLRWQPRPLVLDQHSPHTRRHWITLPRWSYAAALAILLVIISLALLRPAARPADFQITATHGTPQSSSSSARLQVGDSLRTDASSQAIVRVAEIGTVTLLPNSDLSIVESRSDRRRLALRYGTLHASIVAPPSVFVVDTPAARAVDLGCEYDLSVDPAGNGTLRVTSGWVLIDYLNRQYLVPQGAAAVIRSGGQISPPFFEDAVPEFKSSLVRFFVAPQTSPDRAQALRQLLAVSRQRDSYTLISMFRQGTPEERALIFDRLDTLVPAPPGITRDTVVANPSAALDDWWRAVRDQLGLSAIKKKGPMRIGTYTGLQAPTP